MATHRIRVSGPPDKAFHLVDISNQEEHEKMDMLLRRKLSLNHITPFVIIFKGKVFQPTMQFKELIDGMQEGNAYIPGKDMLWVYTCSGDLFATDDEIRRQLLVEDERSAVSRGLDEPPPHQVHPVVALALGLVNVHPDGEKYFHDEDVDVIREELQSCIGKTNLKQAIIDLANLAGLLRDDGGSKAAATIAEIMSLFADEVG